MTSQAGAVATRPMERFKQELALRMPTLQNALVGTGMPSEKFRANVLAAVAANPELLHADRASLFRACLDAAMLGLMVSPTLGQFYLVTFRTKQKDGTYKLLVQGIPGYKGYIHLTRQSGEISALYAHEVYQNDTFKVIFGTDKHLVHEPKLDGDRGPMVGVYCAWKFKDGSTDFEYMSKAEVDEIKARSRGPSGGPWGTDYTQMARKTVIRRAAKYLPLSVQKAAVMDAAVDQGAPTYIDQETGEVIVEEGEIVDITDGGGAEAATQTVAQPKETSLDKFAQKVVADAAQKEPPL